MKTYVRKYIEARYPQPMVLSVKNLIGTVVYALLDKESITNHTKKDGFYIGRKYCILTDAIKVFIPRKEVLEYRRGLSITKLKAIIINSLFEELITEDLHTFCMAYQLAGISNRQAIEDFADKHNIFLETDISYGCFKKSEYRHRKKLNINPTKLSRDFN